MKAEQLAEIILRAPTRSLGDEVRIVVHNPGKVGPRSSVPLQVAGYGTDWERGTFELIPAMPLTRLTPEDVAAIHKSVSAGSSWHAYQAHKKLHERIQQLEAEIASMKGGQ